MRREVVFTKDGDSWLSLDPPGAHIYDNNKFCIVVDIEDKEGESLKELSDRCIKQAVKQLIRRYFNLRSYMK